MEETAASVFGRLLNVFCFYATVRLECFPGGYVMSRLALQKILHSNSHDTRKERKSLVLKLTLPKNEIFKKVINFLDQKPTY